MMECYEGNSTWAAFQRAKALTIFNGYAILNDKLYGIYFLIRMKNFKSLDMMQKPMTGIEWNPQLLHKRTLVL